MKFQVKSSKSDNCNIYEQFYFIRKFAWSFTKALSLTGEKKIVWLEYIWFPVFFDSHLLQPIDFYLPFYEKPKRKVICEKVFENNLIGYVSYCITCGERAIGIRTFRPYFCDEHKENFKNIKLLNL